MPLRGRKTDHSCKHQWKQRAHLKKKVAVSGTKVTTIRTPKIKAMNGNTARQISMKFSRNAVIATMMLSPSGGGGLMGPFGRVQKERTMPNLITLWYM